MLELVEHGQGSFGGIDLGVPAVITSEAQGTAAVEYRIVEKMAFL
jgi:hypothetical protein